ncbi:MAG: DUF1127 domain-containing protein [Fuscovulum sp.]|jgi:uncharacterized protein YjiS (DUF1127 family)|nr:DUF1127 domain-containing protein [Fuscovulum sp.]
MTLLSLSDLHTRPRRHRRGLLGQLAQALSLGRQRAHLARLDDHLLRDIGVSRAEAEAEAARGWDAPAHWRD